MGSVPSPQAVSERHVASLESFPKIERQMRRELAQPENQRLAILPFGSFGYRSYSIRSDVDFVLLYPNGERGAARRVGKNLFQFAEELHVELDPILINHEVAGGSQHGLSLSLMEHLLLMESYGRGINGSIMDKFDLAGKLPLDDLKGYLAKKRHRLESASISEFESSAHRRIFLQKILDLPAHVARKFLRVYGQVADEKAEAISQYRERCSDVAPPFNHLVDLDAEYTACLNGQLLSYDSQVYRRMLRRIETAADVALDFVLWNINYLERHPPEPA